MNCQAKNSKCVNKFLQLKKWSDVFLFFSFHLFPIEDCPFHIISIPLLIQEPNVAPVTQEPGCPENDRLGDGKGMKNMNKELTDVV